VGHKKLIDTKVQDVHLYNEHFLNPDYFNDVPFIVLEWFGKILSPFSVYF
jgi:hypothetical protein